MTGEVPTKVSASHLARTAYLYVRQSTLRQVPSPARASTRYVNGRSRWAGRPSGSW